MIMFVGNNEIIYVGIKIATMAKTTTTVTIVT